MKKAIHALLIALMLITPFIHPYDGVFANAATPTSVKVQDIQVSSVLKDMGDFVYSADAVFNAGEIDLSSYSSIQKVELRAGNTVIKELSALSNGKYSIGEIGGEKIEVESKDSAETPYGYFEWWRDPNKYVWIYDLDNSWHYRNTRPTIFETGPPSTCKSASGVNDLNGYNLNGNCAVGTFYRADYFVNRPMMEIVSTGDQFPISDLKEVSFDPNGLTLTPGRSLTTSNVKKLVTSSLDPVTMRFEFKVEMDFNVPYDSFRLENSSLVGIWDNTWQIKLKGNVYKYSDLSVWVTYGPTGNEPDLGGIVMNAPACLEVGTAGSFNVYFSNNGSRAINTTFKAQVKQGTTVLAEPSYSSLSAGGSKTITFSYSPSFAGIVSFQVILDPDGALNSGPDKEVLRGDNTSTFSFSAKSAGGCGGGSGNSIDGDFDIVPGTISYRDPFDIIPRNIVVTGPGCTYTKHEFLFARSGKIDQSPDVNGKTNTLSMTYSMYKYLPAIAVGTVTVSMKIHTTCGDSGWIKPKPLTVINNGNLPPTLNIAWYARGDRMTPVSTVQEGQPVDLVLVNANDPDGDVVTWNFNFSGSGSPWIQSFPSTYGFGTSQTDYNNIQTMGYSGSHTVTATAEDGQGGQATASASLTIKAPAPIPVITGPTQVVQGRPLPMPFSSSASFSPIGRSINHALDEWGNLRASYPTPGNEVITLWVTDSAGLRSQFMATHSLKVVPDKPPIARLGVPPLGIRNQTYDIANYSYSEDGDTLVSAAYRYKYDANNNGFGDDPWQSLMGTMAKTSFTPNRVGKYLFDVTVCESYGLCADASATQSVTLLVLDTLNIAPFVSFDIFGKNKQPVVNTSIALSAQAIMTWPLYDVNTNKLLQNRPFSWSNRNGVLSAALGRGMERQYDVSDKFYFGNGQYDNRPFLTSFSDNGFGANRISPYKSIDMINPDYSQPVFLPGSDLQNLTPAKFGNMVRTNNSHLIFDQTDSNGYTVSLYGLNLNRLPKYEVKEIVTGPAATVLRHSWPDNVSPYDYMLTSAAPSQKLVIPTPVYTNYATADANKAKIAAGDYSGARAIVNMEYSFTTFMGFEVAGETIYKVVGVDYISQAFFDYFEEEYYDTDPDGNPIGPYGCNCWTMQGYSGLPSKSATGVVMYDSYTGAMKGYNMTNPDLLRISTPLAPFVNTGKQSKYYTMFSKGDNLVLLSKSYGSINQIELDASGNTVRKNTLNLPASTQSINVKFRNAFGTIVQEPSPRTFTCTWGEDFTGLYKGVDGEYYTFAFNSCKDAANNGVDLFLNPELPGGYYALRVNSDFTLAWATKLRGTGYYRDSDFLAPNWENKQVAAFNPETKQLITRSYYYYFQNGAMSPTVSEFQDVIDVTTGVRSDWAGIPIKAMQSSFTILPDGGYVGGSYTSTVNGTLENNASWGMNRYLSKSASQFHSAYLQNSNLVGSQYIADGVHLGIFQAYDYYNAPGYMGQPSYPMDRYMWIAKGTPMESPITRNGSQLGQFVSGSAYDDAELSFTVNMHRPNLDTGLAGMSFRMQDPMNRYAVELDVATLYISRYIGGSRTVLNSIPYMFQANTDYAFKVKMNGGQIDVILGGVPYLSATDSTFATGKIGPFTTKVYVDFKQLSVQDIPEPKIEWLTNYAIWEEDSARAEARYENITYTDPEGDPRAGTNKWSITHTPKFLDNQGVSTLHGQSFATEQLYFDKVGEYWITLQARDDPHPSYLYPSGVFDSYRKDSNAYAERMIVHRRPVALFTVSQNPVDGKMIYNYQDYDPDRWKNAWTYSAPDTPGMNYGVDRGIASRKFYYVTPSGVRVDGKLSGPQEIGNYIIGMQSTDEYGADSVPYEVLIWIGRTGQPNTPPVATMIVPSGTFASPTPVTVFRPTFQWSQTDVDGDLLTAFQVQVLNESSQLLLDSYSTAYTPPTANPTHNWLVTADMPVGKKLQVRVRVSDGTDWSNWSATTWFYIRPNTPPVAAMIVPDGTFASPTVFTVVRPTFVWSQTDVDAGVGDLFEAFQLQVMDAYDQLVFDSAPLAQVPPTASTSQSWAVNVDMPAGQHLQVRVRVYDGTDWSNWSGTTWFFINRPPTATMTVPNGTQAYPTIYNNEFRPTFEWSQTDPDPSTIFSYFHLIVSNEANNIVIHDTGSHWQYGVGNSTWSYAMPFDLPAGQKLRVGVRVFDGYVWSAFSAQTWFYINRPPVANFDWTPKPAYEGDTITITGSFTDPDGDPLTPSWTILSPNGSTSVASTPTYTITNAQKGNYTVTLTVTDPHGLSSSITKTISTLDLAVTGFVEHTDRFEELRKAYNLNASGNPEYPRTADIFAAGEAFMLRADTTDTGTSGTKATSVVVTRYPFTFDTTLTSRTKLNWSGKMVDDDYNEKLTDGDYRFRFDATWSNGHRESVDVIVKVKGDVTLFFSPARLETN